MSTYSSSLRIDLITNGTQAGVWGDTTNNNLAYILDTSIAGYQTVSVTAASQALTYTNGPSTTAANNQSVYAMLKFNGASAPSAIYAPPASKTYIIWNNSGFTLTIYNSTVIGNTTAAGAGITISNGNKVLIWSDATNFYEVQAANLTGTLAIANGGTGQTTANAALNALLPVQTSNANKYLQTDGTNTSWDAISLSTADITGTLAVANGGTGVTSSTGTGSVVLSTSPTLVTPALGTPASGVLTNATGLPLSTGVTGTLAVTNGGTGQATALTQYGLVYGSTTTAMATTLAGTSTQVLHGNASGAPTWGSVSLTADISGTLAVGNGGTGATTSTGSGAVVLATSPTLVTPALGTPASGVLTNATGLPLSTGVTGTLAVANGGTGVTSSTGTGSVVLSTSPTLVTPALGTPASGNLANCTFPTLNQNTTGTAGGLSATLAVTSGGTGQSVALNRWGVIYSSTTSAMASTPAAITTTQVLKGNPSGVPTWGSVDLALDVTGVLGIASGGTGESSRSAAINALLPSQSGASGQYLKSDGTNPSWDAINISTADISGVLAIANGGTNSTATPTNGGVGYGTGTAHAYSAAGTDGYMLKSNGAAAPTWIPQSTIAAGTAIVSTSLSTGGGSAPSYAARAWVSFNGTGTVAIQASGNVTSITDNGVGDYTVNFTTAMQDANYLALACGGATSAAVFANINTSGGSGTIVAPTTSACRFSMLYNVPNGSVVDTPYTYFLVLR